MRKYIKYMIPILVVLAILVGFIEYKKSNKEFIGGFISSKWINESNETAYMVSIDLDNDFSKDEVKYFSSIATKKRKYEVDTSQIIDLGNPTHEISVYREENSTGVTDLVLKYNLWLFEDMGYIQSKKNIDSKISKLDTDEYEFLLNSLLKYHSREEIFKK